MGIELKSGFLGLVTNTADLQAPPGALERARNVVIRRAGACEPRPGVVPWTTLANTQQAIKIIPYELETVLAGYTSSIEWWNVLGNIAILYPPPDGSAAFAPPTFRNDLIPHAQTRGNLYIGTAVGVLKFDGVPDATTGNDMFLTVGAPMMFSLSSTLNAGTGAWLANNMQVRYRVVGVKTDSNGVVTRSRPSGAITVTNTSGGDRYVTVSVTPLVSAPERDRLWDSVELFRTRQFPTSVTPDEEYLLVTSKPIAIIVTINDLVPDAERGATLYTSPSREGEEGANDLPPACGALAVFKGALFCGNTVGPARRVYSYTFGGTVTGSATGIGNRVYNGTYTLGSNQITGLASTVGLQKGMLASDNAGPNPFAGGHITNISGATVTMSVNASAGAVGVPMLFQDARSFDGGTTWQTTVPSQYVTYTITPPLAGYGITRVVETSMPGTASVLAIKATHGNEYFEPLPLFDDPADTGEKDVYPNGLRWSKPDEPEHFPPANTALVGDKKRAILGLVATRDALFIFKEDGIWRLTGIDGQYRIDPFDLTTHCVLPSSIAPLKNRIFMLSNRGVVAVSDDGVEVVSEPINDVLRSTIYGLQVAGAGAGYFITNVGYAGTAVDRDNEYMLFLGSALAGQVVGVSNGGLVYNDVTRAWTSFEFASNAGAMICVPSTWAFQDRAGVVRIAQRAGAGASVGTFLSLAAPGFAAPFASLTTQPYSCDGYSAITVTSGGANITYTPATQLNASDVILSGGVLYRITAVTDTTHCTVDAAMPTGAAHVARPMAVRVSPRAWMEPNQVMKQWTQVVAEFSYLVGAILPYSVADSSLNAAGPAATNQTFFDVAMRTPNQVTWYARGAALRGIFPTAAARGFRLFADVGWSQVYGNAILEAMFVQTVDGKLNAPNLEIKP